MRHNTDKHSCFRELSALCLEKEFAPAKDSKRLTKAVARVLGTMLSIKWNTLHELLAYQQCLDLIIGPCLTLFFKNKTFFVMSLFVMIHTPIFFSSEQL